MKRMELVPLWRCPTCKYVTAQPHRRPPGEPYCRLCDGEMKQVEVASSTATHESENPDG